jgi:iron complex outermembrane receptor protein
MPQSYYSNYSNISFDNLGNSVINPVIPATSNLAKILGINGLKKETSLNFSGGIASTLNDNLTFTADVFQISVDNRIMLSGGIPTATFPEFVAAGFPLQTTVFVNAIDTRTQGLELALNYKWKIQNDSRLILNAAFAAMSTTLRANRKTNNNITVADSIATTFFTNGLPQNKLLVSAMFEYKNLGVWLRASHFGKNSDPTAMLKTAPNDPNAPKYQVFEAKTLLDFGVNYQIIKGLTAQFGVNNLLDVYPDLLQVPQTTNEVIFSRRTNQFGSQGRFFNFTLNYVF